LELSTQDPTQESFDPEPLSDPGCVRDILEGLPQPLALSLKEYLDEQDPYKKLLRMCQCAEMLVRVLNAISFAVLYKADPSAFPRGHLKTAVMGDIEGKCPILRPTFGEWITILRGATTELGSMASDGMPGLAAVAEEVCDFVRPDSTPAPNLCILDLRNKIAHTNRFSSTHANEFLETYGHAKRFEEFWRSRVAPFFAELLFLGVFADGRTTLLHGPVESIMEDSRSPNPIFNTPPPGNLVVVLRKGESDFFDLSPMLFFSPVYSEEVQSAPITKYEVTHAYARSGRLNEYEVMHPSIITGYATQNVQERFERFFPVKTWQLEAEEQERKNLDADHEKKLLTESLRPYAFRDIKKSSTNEPFVGRDRQIDLIFKWSEESTDGCGLVLGLPGMGKTALAVRSGVEIAKRSKRTLTFSFFFKSGDPRCSLRSFIHSVLLHIQANGGPKVEMPKAEEEVLELFESTLRTFMETQLGEGHRHDRLVVVVDGINEIAEVCPRFPDLLFSWNIEKLVWLAFSQPGPRLQASFERYPATLLFEQPGLPPLDPQDVRALLMDELGPRVFEFLNAESIDGSSPFLEELSKRSGSLPLYLHCLIDDLRKGEFNFNQPHKLPASLEDYYSLWLTRADFDPSRTLVAQIIALCANAVMPLTEGMLAHLLQDDPHSQDRDWDLVLADGIKHSTRFLKPAYLWEGLNGFTVFHESFREYLLSQKDGDYVLAPLGPAMRLAQKRLTDLCSRWRQWPPNSPERLYALRHRIYHLAQQKLWPQIFGALTDIEYLEEKLTELEPSHVIDDLQLAARKLPSEAEAAFCYELANAVQFHADFLTHHPKSLFQCAWEVMAPNLEQSSAQGDQAIAQHPAAVLAIWRDHIKSRGIPWLRTLHPPRATRGETPVVHIGVGAPILRTVFSEGGDMIAGFALPKLQPGLSIQPGHTFVWRRMGGTAMNLPWQQGKFAFPLGFGSKGEHLLLATETVTEVWNVAGNFICQTLPAVTHRVVATVPALGDSPFTLLTSEGMLYRWPGPGGEWDTEKLHVQDEILFADLGAGGETWFLVTACGEVLSKGLGTDVTRSSLPKEMIVPPTVFRDESGRILTGRQPGVGYYGQKRAHVDIVIEPMLGGARTKIFFKFYGSLIGPVAVCSQATQSIAILTCEEIDQVSNYDDEYYNGVLHFWSAKTPTEVRRITTEDQNCSAIALNPTGGAIAVGLTNGKVLLLQSKETNHHFELSAHSTPITSLAFSPDGEALASSGKDTFIQPVRDSGKRADLHVGEPAASACSADGQFFASADQDRRIIIWSADFGNPLHVITPIHEGAITALYFVDSSNKLVSVGEDSCFWLWDPGTGKAIACGSLNPSMEVWPPTIHSAFSTGNSRLALMDASGELGVWDLNDKVERIFAAPNELEDPIALAMSASGDVLAVCTAGRIQFMNLNSREWVTEIPAPELLLEHAPWRGQQWLNAQMSLILEIFLESWSSVGGSINPRDVGGAELPSSETQRYKAICEPDQTETRLASALDGEPLAWYPLPLRLLQTSPDGRTFLGFFGSTIHIVRLEL
jgi:hypothetical protein